VVASGVNVQLKSVEAPTSRKVLPPPQDEQPDPVIETFWSGESPVLRSVTVIVTVVPSDTVLPGVTLFVTSDVDG
jgi:hypothetical protein